MLGHLIHAFDQSPQSTGAPQLPAHAPIAPFPHLTYGNLLVPTLPPRCTPAAWAAPYCATFSRYQAPRCTAPPHATPYVWYGATTRPWSATRAWWPTWQGSLPWPPPRARTRPLAPLSVRWQEHQHRHHHQHQQQQQQEWMESPKGQLLVVNGEEGEEGEGAAGRVS